MPRILLRLLADATLIALLLFVPAGTLQWWRAWVLLGVLVVVRGVGAVVVHRANPALLRERSKLPIHAGQPRADRFLLLGVLGSGFFVLPVLATLDVFRWHLLPRPHPVVAWIGLVLFAMGWGLNALALRTNAFATAVVRVQAERRHEVVDWGVYGIVRHPFYTGTLLILAGLGLWLESHAAALYAVLPMGLVVARLLLEERYLRRELAGYADYMARVRYRLLPGIW